MKKKNKDVYTVSIHDLDSIENLKKIIIKANENSA
jgi:hypothetical protein